MASGFADADLVHPVERLAPRYHDLDAVECAHDALDVAHLDEEPGSVSVRPRHEPRRILLDALVRLVHHLDVVLGEDDKPQPVTFGNFRGLGEAEPLPKWHAGFDGVYHDHGAQLLHGALLHGLHGWSLLRLRCWKRSYRRRGLGVLEKWNWSGRAVGDWRRTADDARTAAAGCVQLLAGSRVLRATAACYELLLL